MKQVGIIRSDTLIWHICYTAAVEMLAWKGHNICKMLLTALLCDALQDGILINILNLSYCIKSCKQDFLSSSDWLQTNLPLYFLLKSTNFKLCWLAKTVHHFFFSVGLWLITVWNTRTSWQGLPAIQKIIDFSLKMHGN